MVFKGPKRHPQDARSKLERWILEQGGPSRVAALIGVSPTIVGLWIQRRHSPSLALAIKLVDLARGELTYTDLHTDTTRQKK